MGAEQRGEGGKRQPRCKFMNGAVVSAFWRVSGIAQGGSKPEGRASRRGSIKLAAGVGGEKYQRMTSSRTCKTHFRANFGVINHVEIKVKGEGLTLSSGS